MRPASGLKHRKWSLADRVDGNSVGSFWALISGGRLLDLLILVPSVKLSGGDYFLNLERFLACPRSLCPYVYRGVLWRD